MFNVIELNCESFKETCLMTVLDVVYESEEPTVFWAAIQFITDIKGAPIYL